MLLENYTLEIIIAVYLLFFGLNFGISFAYLQRSKLENSLYKKLPPISGDYIHSFIVSLPGQFGIVGVMKASHFPKYGWKIMPGEGKYSKWIVEYEKRWICNYKNELPSDNGTYKSIWGNSNT